MSLREMGPKLKLLRNDAVTGNWSPIKSAECRRLR